MSEAAFNLMMLSLIGWFVWVFIGIPWAFIKLGWSLHNERGDKWSGFKNLFFWFVINVGVMVYYGYTYGNWG